MVYGPMSQCVVMLCFCPGNSGVRMYSLKIIVFVQSIHLWKLISFFLRIISALFFFPSAGLHIRSCLTLFKMDICGCTCLRILSLNKKKVWKATGDYELTLRVEWIQRSLGSRDGRRYVCSFFMMMMMMIRITPQPPGDEGQSPR